tara:strand:- start:3238 stop:3897 length:660 start_codon:yes stop_codon:yes gene_type:complete
MKKQKKITIGVLNHNQEIFDNFFNKSIKNLKNNYEIIVKYNLKPARAFNEIINESNNDYILLVHADVLFDDKFINTLENNIKKFPDFGAMGVVGVYKPFLRKKKYIKSNISNNLCVTTLDSCCILINKKHKLKFDYCKFDEFHHFVEDYCMQVKYNLKLKIYLISTNFYCDTLSKKSEFNENYFYHGSSTIKQKGSRWGKWEYYKKILDKKWKRKIITT